MPSDREIVPFEREHLPGVMELFGQERWSYAEDQERTWRALIAPGSLTLVAVSHTTVVGITQALGDGEIQAFLSVLLVAETQRRQGIARSLVNQILSQVRGLRLDAISSADILYEALDFRQVSGFRRTLDSQSAT